MVNFRVEEPFFPLVLERVTQLAPQEASQAMLDVMVVDFVSPSAEAERDVVPTFSSGINASCVTLTTCASLRSEFVIFIVAVRDVVVVLAATVSFNVETPLEPLEGVIITQPASQVAFHNEDDCTSIVVSSPLEIAEMLFTDTERYFSLVSSTQPQNVRVAQKINNRNRFIVI